MVRRAMNLEEEQEARRGGEWEGRRDKWAFFTSPPEPPNWPRRKAPHGWGALSQSAPRMASSPAREIPSSGARSCSPPPKPRHVPRPCTPSTPSTTAHPIRWRALCIAGDISAWARAQPRLISQLRPHRTSQISNHPHSSRCRVFFSFSLSLDRRRRRTARLAGSPRLLSWPSPVTARRRWWTGLINRP